MHLVLDSGSSGIPKMTHSQCKLHYMHVVLNSKVLKESDSTQLVLVDTAVQKYYSQAPGGTDAGSHNLSHDPRQ